MQFGTIVAGTVRAVLARAHVVSATRRPPLKPRARIDGARLDDMVASRYWGLDRYTCSRLQEVARDRNLHLYAPMLPQKSWAEAWGDLDAHLAELQADHRIAAAAHPFEEVANRLERSTGEMPFNRAQITKGQLLTWLDGLHPEVSRRNRRAWDDMLESRTNPLSIVQLFSSLWVKPHSFTGITRKHWPAAADYLVKAAADVAQRARSGDTDLYKEPDSSPQGVRRKT